MSQHDQTIARINALTSNARNTWFALLSALLFVGVTLMGVEHIDFYGVDRATQLPLINVSVPTPLFFYAAPLLTAAIYGYFHLYLIRLWDALGSAPARVNGDRLGDAIAPWLVTDAALHLRGWLRQDECTRPRAFEWASMLLNILLAWVFGIVILVGLWWQSMPARDLFMNSVAGASMIAVATAGAASLSMLVLRMRSENKEDFAGTFISVPAVGRTLALLPIVLTVGYQRTVGDADLLAPLDLSGEAIVAKPVDWLPEEIARKDFLAIWCKREKHACVTRSALPEGFSEEWKTRRDAQIAALRKPNWSRRQSTRVMDFRGANLRGAFLVGADLVGAQLQKSNLLRAQLQSANLNKAQLQGAFLWRAQLQRADLWRAQLQEADLIEAQLQGADLSETQLQGAYLREAQLQGAVLIGAQLSVSHLNGRPDKPLHLEKTNLIASTNNGGALKFADLTEAAFNWRTDWRNIFLDASVSMTDVFRQQMGGLCQQAPTILGEEEFYAHWRGWLEAAPEGFEYDWKTIAPAWYHNIPPIAPPGRLPLENRPDEAGV